METTSPSPLTGIHHLTAVTAQIRENHAFYTHTLGLRLVKRSVNQDDVSAYHLFYADGAGSPGTDLTFFDWQLPRERRGTHSLSRTGLRVQGRETLAWWQRRLQERGVEVDSLQELDGRLTLPFYDAEGQRLALVDDGGLGDPPVVWGASPIPPEHQIRGLGPIVMSAPVLDPTEMILTAVLGMKRDREYRDPWSPGDTVTVFSMGSEGPSAELHVAVNPNLLPARLGAGGVHHVAFRTPTESSYRAWIQRLNQLRVPNSGPVDRFYFQSLYFREPGGVLFEIATDGPGFHVDEEVETMGESLALPPFLEPRRTTIEAGLTPID
ncbi:MAG: ring-cleaving dioxygenase [Gemmatimonadota bacterium]